MCHLCYSLNMCRYSEDTMMARSTMASKHLTGGGHMTHNTLAHTTTNLNGWRPLRYNQNVKIAVTWIFVFLT